MRADRFERDYKEGVARGASALDALAMFQPYAQAPEPALNRPKFSFRRAGEMTEKPVPEKYLVRGLLPKESYGQVFGPPANGKSLFVLDISFCITAGIDYEGRATEQGDVIIIAGEGFHGYSKRLKALEAKHGIKAPMNLAISEQAAQLNDAGSCDDVAQAIRESGLNPKLIIIDTLNRNFCADENSSRDIAQLMMNLQLHFKQFGATIIIVHHSGHGTEQRSRGSSAIRGALDFEYSVIKDSESNVVITNHKAKDFEPPQPLGFVLKPVKLNWLTEEGEQQTSVYLEYTGDAEKSVKKGKLNPRDQQILQSLTDALDRHGVEPTAEMRQKFGGFNTGIFAKVVKLDDWRPYAYKAIPTDDSENPGAKQRNALKRFKDKFIQSCLMEYDGYIWRIEPNANKGPAELDTTMFDDIPAIDSVTSVTERNKDNSHTNPVDPDNSERNNSIKNDCYAFNANNDAALSDSVTSVTERNKDKSVTEGERNERNTLLRSVTVVTHTPTPDILDDDVEIF
ncbi:MAG: AAA family ATPase [Methylococcales bacterium]|nr:AAA family ATPase [Methylococcales bacterium]